MKTNWKIDLKTLLWMLMIFPGIFLLLASLLGYMEFLGDIVDLWNHFRVQYFVAGLVLMIAFWGFSQFSSESPPFKWLLIPCVILLVNGIELLPFFLPVEKPETMTTHLKVMQVNVMAKNRQYNRVFEYIHKMKPDVIAIEEVDPYWAEALHKLPGYPYHIIEPHKGYFGVALLSKFPLKEKQVFYSSLLKFASISAVISLNQKNIQLFVVHPPAPTNLDTTSDRNAQLLTIAEKIQKQALGTSYLVMGDFNATSFSSIFKEMTFRGKLLDTSHGFGIQPTWPSFFPLLSLAIDHVLTSPDFVTLSREIGPHINSDHYPLFVELGLRQ